MLAGIGGQHPMTRRMRSAQKRTIEDAWRHIGSLVETIDPTECNNYFANAGYASVKK